VTWVLLGAVLAAAAVVVVALPFLREPHAADDRLDAPTAGEERRRELVEARDRALAALKELEFDHRTGKITDDDYRELVSPLRRAAASALKALDEGTPRESAGVRSLAPPEQPSVPEPAPPPDEGTPPTPAPVPEPYPPPDEATPPREPLVPERGPQE
jgi:hypothetical protein